MVYSNPIRALNYRVANSCIEPEINLLDNIVNYIDYLSVFKEIVEHLSNTSFHTVENGLR